MLRERASQSVRICAAAIAASLCTLAPTAAHADGPLPGNGSWHPPPARYGMSSQRTDVRMSDGTDLSATVTVPTDPATKLPAAGRFPVLISVTPYGKDEPGLAGVNVTPAQDYVPYGYVDVVVDVRGTGSSGGSFELFGSREVSDYVEIIDWAAHLPASDGRVGMVGESYLALAQLFAAGAVGPGSPLKAIFPIDAGADLYRDLVVPGGMFNNMFDTPYTGLEIGMDTLGPLASGHSLPQAVQDVGLHLAGNAEIDGRTLTDAFDGGDRAYDEDFYLQRDLSAAISRIPANGVAVFAYNSLFDLWQRGDPLVYSILQNAAAGRPPLAPMAPDQRPDPRFQVVLGPYAHVESGERLAGRLALLSLEWFDTWLKGEPTGMADTSTPLHPYEIQGGRWTDATHWPPETARAQHLYFDRTASSSGAPSLNDGSLASAPPAHAAERLPWNGGVDSPCSRETYQQANSYLFTPGQFTNPCFYDDRGLEVGALTYTTPPLKQALDIAGPADVTVYASANTTNSEWVVTLNDVAPDGTARSLATGDLIGSLRALDATRSWNLDSRLLMPWHAYTRAGEQPVAPGQIERYDVELPGTVARIARGDRIRVTVQSSDAPYLEPTFPDQSQLQGGTYYVQDGGAQPSSVSLPVIEPGDLTTSPVDWGACFNDCGTRDLAAERLRTEGSPAHPGSTSSRLTAACPRRGLLLLRRPRLRRGERVRSLRVSVGGRRARVLRVHGRLAVRVPAGATRIRVRWRTNRRLIAGTRRLAASCHTSAHRRHSRRRHARGRDRR